MEQRKIKVGLKVFNWLGQKALSQSDLRILESAWSKVRVNVLTWFMACRYRLKKCERCFVSFYLSMVKKALSKSGVSPKQLGLIAYFFCMFV